MNKFTSKLPKAVKQAEAEASQLRQGRLDGHLREIVPTTKVAPYSDKAFREAAVEWLIATDQV
jgi:hypothetical protein